MIIEREAVGNWAVEESWYALVVWNWMLCYVALVLWDADQKIAVPQESGLQKNLTYLCTTIWLFQCKKFFITSFYQT